MAISFDEMDGSPQETLEFGSFKATRKVLVAWSDRLVFLDGLAWPGEVYPYRNNGPSYGARALNASAVPFGKCSAHPDTSGLVEYPQAIVTIQYATPTSLTPVQVGDSGTFITESLEPNAEFLTLDHHDFRWDSIDGDPLKQEEAPGMLQRSMDILITIHRAKSIPTYVTGLLGKVNTSILKLELLRGIEFASETLLFNPPRISSQDEIVNGQPEKRFTIALRFSYKPGGWNSYWRPKAKGEDKWSDIYVAGGEKGKPYRSYPKGNFREIKY